MDNFANISLGTDIEENARFDGKTLESDEHFLRKIFTENELNYCFLNKNSAQHLCARFCAKEAVTKALTELNIKDVFYSDIEIIRNKNEAPYVYIKKYPNIKSKLSISHCKTYSTATVILYLV